MNVFTTYCPGYHGVYDIAKSTERDIPRLYYLIFLQHNVK